MQANPGQPLHQSAPNWKIELYIARLNSRVEGERLRRQVDKPGFAGSTSLPCADGKEFARHMLADVTANAAEADRVLPCSGGR